MALVMATIMLRGNRAFRNLLETIFLHIAEPNRSSRQRFLVTMVVQSLKVQSMVGPFVCRRRKIFDWSFYSLLQHGGYCLQRRILVHRIRFQFFWIDWARASNRGREAAEEGFNACSMWNFTANKGEGPLTTKCVLKPYAFSSFQICGYEEN